MGRSVPTAAGKELDSVKVELRAMINDMRNLIGQAQDVESKVQS